MTGVKARFFSSNTTRCSSALVRSRKIVSVVCSVMASKAYVASMTVTELKQELKQRGLSTRGSKKSLRDRLERAFDEEELDDPSSESDSGQLGPAEAGFNFNVPEESFLPADQIREDSPVLSPSREKMIISVELSNKETLEVYSPQPPPVHDGEGEGGGDKSGPLVVAVSLPNDGAPLDGMGVTENHNSLPTVATVMVEPETTAEEESSSYTITSEPLGVEGTNIEPKTAAPGDIELAGTSLSVEVPPAEVSVEDRAEPAPAEGDEANVANQGGEGGGGHEEDEKDEVVSAENQVGVDEQLELRVGEEQAEENTVSESCEMVTEVNKPSLHPPEEAVEDMELDSSEPLQSLPISTECPEEGGPDSKAEEMGGQGEGKGGREEEGEEEVAQIDDEGMKGSVEGTEQVAEEREELPNESQVAALPSSDTCVGNVDTVQTESREDADWVIVEKPEEENSKDVEAPCEEGSEFAGEVKASSEERAEVTVAPQEMGKDESHQEEEGVRTTEEEGSHQEEEGVQTTEGERSHQEEEGVQTTEGERSHQEEEGVQTTEAEKSLEEEKEEAEKGNEMKLDMEIDESSHEEVRAIPQGEEQKQQPMETEKVHQAKEAPPTPPAASQEGHHPTPEKHAPEDSTPQVLSSSSPHSETSTKQGDAIVDKPPAATEAAVPEEVSTESGQIEVAVLVHAEEDDLSVFSTEAAEAQKIASSREKERGKPREKVRDRDRDRDRNKHRRASASSSAASLSSSKQQSPRVDEGTGSNASSRSSSEAARLSPNEETRHDGEETENQAEPPLKRKRRISAHVSSSATDPPSIQWGGGGEKRRRWGSGKQRSTSNTTNISSDILKDIIPQEVEMEEGEGGGEGVLEGEGEGTAGEEIQKEGEEVNGDQDKTSEKEKDEHQLEWERKVKEREAKQREAERARQELETRHRIEARIRARQESDAKSTKQQEEKEPGKRRSPSPARNPTSHILHVENMTRPFTLGQLRELLTQDGPLLKDGFWTNNVKSHCIGVFASKEVAAATRRRLHGLKWPSTNPKLLAVDFLSPDQVQKISDGDLVVMEAPAEVERMEGEEERGEEVKGDGGSGDLVKEEQVEGGEGKSEEGTRKRRRESERERQDKVKEDKDKDEETKKDVSDDVSKPVKAAKPATDPAPVQEKSSQATRLLDDLFRKTKATPSIYWLPLSEAEVQQKKLEREAREAEREKRRQERQKAYEEERRKEREREEMAKKERERRIQEERDRRARERVHRRSRDSRSRSRSRDRYRDRSRR